MYSGAFKSTLPRTSKVGQVDAELVLRAYSAAAASATTNGTPVEYPLTSQESMKVIINQAAYSSYSAGSVSWTLSLQVSDTVGGTYKEVASIAPTVAAGAALKQQEVFLSGSQINKVVANARFLRIVATKLSTAGDLTFGAYLVPVVGQ